MAVQYFNKYHLSVVGDALDIAEDMTSNYFKLSLLHWKRNRFDIRTLSSLFGEEIKNNVFALLKKYISDGKAEIEPINKGLNFTLFICRITTFYKPFKGTVILNFSHFWRIYLPMNWCILYGSVSFK